MVSERLGLCQSLEFHNEVEIAEWTISEISNIVPTPLDSQKKQTKKKQKKKHNFRVFRALLLFQRHD